MKKLLLLIAIVFTFVAVQAQPCVPDTSINTIGIYPINGSSNGFYVYMPDAYAGAPYNEIVQIKAPSDTVIDTLGQTIPATIVWIKIIDFVGLPNSIMYQCDTANCTWSGGSNGCALFTGTPSQADIGLHVIDIKATGYVDIGIFQIEDTIEFTMELNVLPAQGIDEYISSSSVNVSPNPFSVDATLTFQAMKREAYTLKMLDMTGRVVQVISGKTNPGANSIKLNREGLPDGLYFYNLEVQGHSVSGRMVVAD